MILIGSKTFVQSLINLQKYKEAYSFSKSLDKKGNANLENNLFLGLFEFKNKNYIQAKIHFSKLNLNIDNRLIFEPTPNALLDHQQMQHQCQS